MKKISPKAIRLWRIKAGIYAFIFLLATALVYILSVTALDFLPWYIPAVFLLITVYIVVVDIWLVPKLKFRYFRYGIFDDEIHVHEGIFIKRQKTVPIYRIQNIDTTVGPLMRRMNLKGISLRTPAERVYIPELHEGDADQLRAMIRDIINNQSRLEV
ncbi:PH domain-containing protein [Salinicoccus halitifaciens]|uniref:Membrane protein YdbS with pleckstrin-like domain n=1 Tax=Salinicoccus halitifaciens TaxID=1073415 RepID=A0ABV2E959_9STAP|nr:PH domain-containing protein [Salinicoccus halitifaciens]MCD2138098.1 PH domain-containing protein [Salinicoccus halitifaciens]